MVLDDLVERLPENFDLEDIRGRVDEYSPYVMVAIQVTPNTSERALFDGAWTQGNGKDECSASRNEEESG